MGRKKTHTEFIKELKIVNPEITIIDEYVNKRTSSFARFAIGVSLLKLISNCN